MSLATDPSDALLKDWQPFSKQATLVNYTARQQEHGWVQQDPSRGWLDSAPHDPKRWLFLGGTSVNGSQANPSGVPVIELFGSRAGSDWAQGFEYLGVFSADGLAMCDPELITWPGSEIAALYGPPLVTTPSLRNGGTLVFGSVGLRLGCRYAGIAYEAVIKVTQSRKNT